MCERYTSGDITLLKHYVPVPKKVILVCWMYYRCQALKSLPLPLLFSDNNYYFAYIVSCSLMSLENTQVT